MHTAFVRWLIFCQNMRMLAVIPQQAQTLFIHFFAFRSVRSVQAGVGGSGTGPSQCIVLKFRLGRWFFSLFSGPVPSQVAGFVLRHALLHFFSGFSARLTNPAEPSFFPISC